MAILDTEFDARIDALVALFEADTTMGSSLPGDVATHKGPAYATGEPFAVFINRAGIPSVQYNMGAKTADIEMDIYVAGAVAYASTEEEVESYVNILAANTIRRLFANVQVSGIAGWYAGLVQGSDAVAYREKFGTQGFELEVWVFRIKFEVSYA